ncbi:DNA polymerase III [Paenibacillus alginolyticus]|uniref:DNA polymerase III n=1 Tax=Paenibacillus alginolyticus TaxID=59839 RepID=A0ABT4GNX6_9BACL|nr:DNA polymerase III [Paenibacillus alginolyticus]MCY9697919.1 DNA polymerase III [Paenibacillus alginolyticus]MEC0141789.1 DNA polymerase III [Paenibacillus alginolyticus]
MKKQLLYHACLPENHEYHVPLTQIMEEGITPSTKSNYWYSNGGKVKKNIADKLRPTNAPDWLDFNSAIGVNIEKTVSKALCFPVFTDKIMVFDSEVSMLIYDQAFYDDNQYTFEEALDFDTGEAIEDLIQKYWERMMTLEDYLKEIPYKKPEILLFQLVPSNLIQVSE